MTDSFTHASLGATGRRVCRLGLSGSYRPGKRTIYRALDAGLDFFFGYGFDGQMTSVMRQVLKTDRDRYVIATGAYNLIWGYPNIRRTLEKRLRQWGTDRLDLFLFLGVMKEKEFPARARDEMRRLQEEGKVGAIGMSCHDRKFAGRLAAEGGLDVLMIRYNAAHRGAEQDIFPQLAAHDPGVVSYTATRWTYLIRHQRGWPKGRPIPTPEQSYRFVLSNPHVDVCLTAPTNLAQLEHNLTALARGPLAPDEMALLRDYGDLVHQKKHWFM